MNTIGYLHTEPGDNMIYQAFIWYKHCIKNELNRRNICKSLSLCVLSRTFPVVVLFIIFCKLNERKQIHVVSPEYVISIIKYPFSAAYNSYQQVNILLSVFDK